MYTGKSTFLFTIQNCKETQIFQAQVDRYRCASSTQFYWVAKQVAQADLEHIYEYIRKV